MIERNKQEIKNAVNDAESIEEADEQIENVLADEWQYFTRDYILDAGPQHIDSLFELSSEVIVGHNSIRENSERARQAITEKYDLTDEQENWVEMFVERSVIEKRTISKQQMLEKPFSDHGGYDQAVKVFKNPSLEEIITEFNNHLLSIPETPSNKTGDAQSTNATDYV